LAFSVVFLFDDFVVEVLALEAFEVFARPPVAALLTAAFLVVFFADADFLVVVLPVVVFGLDAAFVVLLAFLAEDAFFFVTVAFDFTVPAAAVRDFVAEVLVAFRLDLLD
jgi:hypothetical protein